MFMNLSSLLRCALSVTTAVAIVLSTTTTAFASNSCASTKDPFLKPFSKDSAHNRPIGTGAQYVGDSHPATRAWLQASRFGINRGGPWGVDVAKTDGSDPIRNVQARAIGTNVQSLPSSMRLPKNGLITNVKAGPTDGVAVFVDSTTGVAHQLRQFDWNGGNPVAAQYFKWSINGLGHGTRMGDRQGTSASGVAAMFGVLRGHAINTPGHPIDHALQIVLPGRAGCNMMLSKDIILPAVTRDGFASQAGNNTGPIPYGALMALPRGFNINNLGLSEPGLRLARAIQNYGIYVVDNGGCGAGAIRSDQLVSPQIANQLIQNDIPKIYRHIRMVSNSEWRPGQAATGGGQPIAPNCALGAGATTVAAPSTPPAPVVSREQSAPPPSSSGSGGGGSVSSSTLPAGLESNPNWQKAQRFWDWTRMSVETMSRSSPGSSTYQTAKANYNRNIALYIEHAAKAGVTVTADISPDEALRGTTTPTGI
jgi:hypothetical protein